MGDEQGQGSLTPQIPFVIFLDENHCRNPHLIDAIEAAGIACEKHLDHFRRGTEDIVWLPKVGERQWCLLTTDARIRSNFLEREAVRQNGVRMFYFSRNNLSGAEMGRAIAKALPAMAALVRSQPAPFTASINKSGVVTLRDTFGPRLPEKIG
jgi:hypothetical protein